MSHTMGNAASQLEPLPTVCRELTADQARRINSLRLKSPPKPAPSQEADQFMAEDSIHLASDLDTAVLDPNARTLLDEYETHGNNQREINTGFYGLSEHAKRDKGTRTQLVRGISTSTKKKQHLDPTTLKSINQFARRHVFFTDQSFQKYTTSQRRTFERAVYDYARSIGLSKAQAEASRIYARRLCGEENYNSDDSRLDEDEIDDPAALLNQPSTGAEVPASSGTTDGVNIQNHSDNAPEIQIEKKVQSEGVTTSSASPSAEVHCTDKDGAAAATMTPAIPALRDQSLVDGPGDEGLKELSSKPDNALPMATTDDVPAPETIINATAPVRPETANGGNEHPEAAGSMDDIANHAGEMRADADDSKDIRPEHVPTTSGGVPATVENRGDAAAVESSTGPAMMGIAGTSRANAKDPVDDQQNVKIADKQTQPQLGTGGQCSDHHESAYAAHLQESKTLPNEGRPVRAAQGVRCKSSQKATQEQKQTTNATSKPAFAQAPSKAQFTDVEEDQRVLGLKFWSHFKYGAQEYHDEQTIESLKAKVLPSIQIAQSFVKLEGRQGKLELANQLKRAFKYGSRKYCRHFPKENWSEGTELRKTLKGQIDAVMADRKRQLRENAQRIAQDLRATVVMQDQDEARDSEQSTDSSESGEGDSSIDTSDVENYENEKAKFLGQSGTDREVEGTTESTEEDDASGDSENSDDDEKEADNSSSTEEAGSSDSSGESEEEEKPEDQGQQAEENRKEKDSLVRKWLAEASVAPTSNGQPSENSLQCGKCKYVFLCKSQLIQHLTDTAPRSGTKTIPCSVCHGMFAKRIDLAKHTEAKHGSPPEDCKKRKQAGEAEGEKPRKLRKSEVRSSTGQFTPSDSS